MRKLTDVERKIVNDFHKLYLSFGSDIKCTWLGRTVTKYPSDMVLAQEIIYDKKPDVIIETGTYYGGSASFYATVMGAMGNGDVITIDTSGIMGPRHARITYVKGKSTSPDVIESVRERVKGKSVMVVLDSDHHKEHVLKEMEIYSDFVTPDQFMIVEDTHVNGNPIRVNYGPGPMEAVDEFMKLHNRDRFTITDAEEKYLMSWHYRGFLLKS